LSKGSTPRPISVSNEEYAARWDAIFQRDLKEEHEIQKVRAAIEELFAEDQRKEDENGNETTN